jgi:hypothetical protein
MDVCGGIQDAHGFFGYLGSYAIAGNQGNSM